MVETSICSNRVVMMRRSVQRKITDNHSIFNKISSIGCYLDKIMQINLLIWLNPDGTFDSKNKALRLINLHLKDLPKKSFKTFILLTLTFYI